MHLYAIAIGSNRPGGRGRGPRAQVGEALARLAALGRIEAVSPVIDTPALGPAGRRFANAAAILATTMDPPALLAALKAIERAMGRRAGRRWGARTIDLDILLWSGGCWRTRTLVIPHPSLDIRRFVLVPLVRIAPDWRSPANGLSVRQMDARLTHGHPRHTSRSR